jgi:dihydroxyacetone kinase-like predicted kinase
VLEGVEIANMHRQTAEREERLLEDPPAREAVPQQACEVVAVVAGSGNRAIFESLGATRIVEGGQSMNPSAAELVAAIDAARAGEVLVLPNNANVLLTAEQAASLAQKRVEVLPTDSIQAGLAAMVVFDARLGAAANAEAMRSALSAVVTGEVTVASRDALLNGIAVREGAYLGLAEGEPVACGADFDEVAGAVVERLLSARRDVVTLLVGEEDPGLEPLLAWVAERHPEVEVDVQTGGQPHYPLLLAAE